MQVDPQSTIDKLCQQAQELVRSSDAIDEYEVKMRSLLGICVSSFRVAAKQYEGCTNLFNLERAKEIVYTFSSTDMAPLMLQYPETQQAFFVLQGAANRLGYSKKIPDRAAMPG